MTIDEAIRIKSLVGEEFLHTDPDDIDKADSLSIEALKRLEERRGFAIPADLKLLPGETK